MMDTQKVILGCTTVAVVILGVIDYRLHKRFDRIDRDHAQMHKEQLDRHDGGWHKLELIGAHLKSVITAIVAPWKNK